MKKKLNFSSVLLILFIIIFIGSSIVLIQYYLNGLKNKELYKDINETENTDEALTNDPLDKLKKIMEEKKESFKNIREINSEAIGWIYIEGTLIDYPILQSNDNEFYLLRNYKKEETKYGSIFADYRNLLEDSFLDLNDNLILYGHHMKDNQMFGDLKKFTDESFFNTTIGLIINDSIYFATPFSVYVTDTNFDYLVPKFNSELEYSEFLSIIKNKSYFNSTIDIKPNDNILTLSTCSFESDNSRLVLHAKIEKT